MSVAWVTGAGTGIGRAVAEMLYRRGDQVVLTGRRADILKRAAEEIVAYPGGGLKVFPGDASSENDIRKVVDSVVPDWGPISILVNNAGSNLYDTLDQSSLDDFRKALDNNCLSAIACAKAVLPTMRKRNQGTIVNISSIYGRWGSGRSASYTVSKFALSGATDVLRQDVIGTGIHVLGVFPGFIRTPMTMPFVVPGSLRDRLGATPEAMAGAILRAMKSGQSELYFPWYVPWVLRAHRWFPGTMDRLAGRVKR